MALEVRLEPEGQENNEYATPCYFNFDNEEDAVALFKIVIKNGDKAAMYIKESE